MAVQRNYYTFAKRNKILIGRKRKTRLQMPPLCQVLRDGNEEEVVSKHVETQIALPKVHHLEMCTQQPSSTVESTFFLTAASEMHLPISREI